MDFKIKDMILTVFPVGRIDSTNAEAIGAEIAALQAAHPHEGLVLDAEALDYLSSAGLRVVLKLRKSEQDMKIVNVSPDVYEILDMTGFSEMMPVERAFRKLSVDGCPVIGRGARGTVYRFGDDTIIKVYHDPDSLPDIKRERELARRAFVLGVPTAISYDIVKVNDKFGTMFELLDARSLTQVLNAEPENADAYLSEYARLLKRIHETEVGPEDMPDIKERAMTWFSSAAAELPAGAVERLTGMIRALPDTLTMLHCDFHTNNVMMQGGEMLLIDMDTISRGYPIFDLAIIYSAYIAFEAAMPGNTERFFGITPAMAERLWNVVLHTYFAGTDEKTVAAAEEKIALLGTLRALNFMLRFSDRGAADFADRLAGTRARIIDLLDRVDSLTF